MPAQPGDPAGQAHTGHGDKGPAASAGQPQQLVGQRKRRAVGLHHDVDDRAERCGVDQLGQVPRGTGVEQRVAQPVACVGQVRARARRIRGLCRPHRVKPERQRRAALPQHGVGKDRPRGQPAVGEPHLSDDLMDERSRPPRGTGGQRRPARHPGIRHDNRARGPYPGLSEGRLNLVRLTGQDAQQRLHAARGDLRDRVVGRRVRAEERRDVLDRTAGQQHRQELRHPGRPVAVQLLADQRCLELHPAALIRGGLTLAAAAVLRRDDNQYVVGRTDLGQHPQRPVLPAFGRGLVELRVDPPRPQEDPQIPDGVVVLGRSVGVGDKHPWWTVRRGSVISAVTIVAAAGRAAACPVSHIIPRRRRTRGS